MGKIYTRQEKICQSQSLNLKVRKDITLRQMSDIHMLAYFKKIKTLYYLRAEKPKQVSMASGGIQQPLNKVEVNVNFEECLSCSG